MEVIMKVIFNRMSYKEKELICGIMVVVIKEIGLMGK
jgi:hypothetical protein